MVLRTIYSLSLTIANGTNSILSCQVLLHFTDALCDILWQLQEHERWENVVGDGINRSGQKNCRGGDCAGLAVKLGWLQVPGVEWDLMKAKPHRCSADPTRNVVHGFCIFMFPSF